MRVVEIFHSLQGEGMLVGTPSVFVRLAGCPVRCPWCDTKYAWDFSAGEELDTGQIIQRVDQWPCRFVVLTGGEPMVGPDFAVRAGLAELTRRLKGLGKHVTIETSGILFIPDLACDLMSISPKLEGWAVPADERGQTPSLVGSARSTSPARSDVAATRRLMRAYFCQLKFVVESPQDMAWIQRVLDELGPVDPERVLLMPQAATIEQWRARSPAVAELCKQTGLRFGPRLHVALWGGRRGV
jgi:7-carboxy-7-deazaguanine synthase